MIFQYILEDSCFKLQCQPTLSLVPGSGVIGMLDGMESDDVLPLGHVLLMCTGMWVATDANVIFLPDECCQIKCGSFYLDLN